MKKLLLLMTLILTLVSCGTQASKEAEVKEVVQEEVQVEDGYVLVEGGTFTMGDTFGDGKKTKNQHIA